MMPYKSRRSPEKKVNGDVFAGREALHENVGGILGHQVADVENADQRTELLAFKCASLMRPSVAAYEIVCPQNEYACPRDGMR